MKIIISVSLLTLYFHKIRIDLFRTQRELTISNERLELAFEGANDGLWDWDVKKGTIYYSPKCKEIMGYDDSEIPQDFTGWLLMIHPKDRDDIKNKLNAYFRIKMPHLQAEFRIMSKSGSYIWLLARGKALWDSDRNLARMAGSITDITERKNLENRLIKNMEEARAFQIKLLPDVLPQSNRVSIDASYTPAESIGGDIYGTMEKDGRLLLYIADVSGSGVPAAMISTYITALLKHCILKNAMPDTAEILNRVKDAISGEALFEDKYLTMLVCSIDLETLDMEYSNAGHCYPLIDRKNQQVLLKNSEKVISGYYNSTTYNTFKYRLEPFDRLLLYTDGLLEWRSYYKFFGGNEFRSYITKNGLNKKTLDLLVTQCKLSDRSHDDISYILAEFYKTIYKTVQSTRADIDSLLSMLADEVKNLYGGRAQLPGILQASTEVIFNSLEHGNRFDSGKQIAVTMCMGRNLFELNVRDEGEGFDWKSVLSAQCACPDSDRGRGICITRHYADEISFNEKGNEVRLKFAI